MTDQRAYWLDLFTWKTWQEFLAAGASVSGFRQGRRGYVEQMKPGDYLLCYLVGVSRFIAMLEVTSPPYNDEVTPIWSAETFPARVRTRVVVQLKPETAVPVDTLLSRFSWYPHLKNPPRGWEFHFHGSPQHITPADARLIIDAIRDADENPVERPYDQRRLGRRAQSGKPQPPRAARENPALLQPAASPVEEAAAVEAGPAAAPAAISGDEEGRSPVEVKAHTEIEGLLLELGSGMGGRVISRPETGQWCGTDRLC